MLRGTWRIIHPCYLADATLDESFNGCGLWRRARRLRLFSWRRISAVSRRLARFSSRVAFAVDCVAVISTVVAAVLAVSDVSVDDFASFA